MSNGSAPLVVGIVGLVSMFGAWHFYDKHAEYAKEAPHELILQSINYSQKQQSSGETLSYLAGTFVDVQTNRTFTHPVSQFTKDQFDSTAKDLRQPVMGHPYVPRPELRMELELSEKDIAQDKGKDAWMGYAIGLGVLSALCFMILS